MKERINAELAKIKEMDSKKRFDYFVSYYLVKTLIGLFLLFCFGWFLYDAVFSSKHIVYSGASVGVTVSEAGNTFLTDSFLDELGGNKKKDAVIFTDNLYMSFTDEEAYQNQSTDTAIYTLLAAGEFQYLLLSKTFLPRYAGMDAFEDLSDLIKEYNIEKNDCYVDSNGDVLAIRLDESACKKIGCTADEEVYFALVHTNVEPEYNKKFIAYLLRDK